MVPDSRFPFKTMQATITALNWLFRQFGRASMLARLSMLFNVVLAWSVYLIHLNEDSLRREVIECHRTRYEDFRRIVEEQKIIKTQIKAHDEKIRDDQQDIDNIQP